MPSKSVHFIVNPAGRGGKSNAHWDALAPHIFDALASTNPDQAWIPTVHKTSAPGDAERLAASCSSSHVVVAVGGDGTLHEVVNGLMTNPSSPPPALVVLPLGTGSDFARTLSTLSPPPEASSSSTPSSSLSTTTRLQANQKRLQGVKDAALVNHLVRRIQSGTPLSIDIGRVTCTRSSLPVSRFFVNIASCGLSARVAQHVPPFKRLGAKWSYHAATVVGFLKHRNRAVELDCWLSPDQDPLAVAQSVTPPSLASPLTSAPSLHLSCPRLTMVAVANGCYFGGGMKIAPHAKLTNRSLNLVTVDGFNLVDFILKSHKLRRGTHLDEHGVSSMRVTRVDVRAARQEDNGAMAWELDGEVLGTLPATIQVIPNALTLLI